MSLTRLLPGAIQLFSKIQLASQNRRDSAMFGMFAVCYWSDITNSLVVARDRAGGGNGGLFPVPKHTHPNTTTTTTKKNKILGNLVHEAFFS